MNESQSNEIYDCAGNVNPEIADKFQCASEIYELALKYSEQDCVLKTAVCLTILLGLNLPEAWQYTLEISKKRVSK
jgi:hypothetical protein